MRKDETKWFNTYSGYFCKFCNFGNFHCTCKLDAFENHLLSSHLAKLSKTWFECYFKIVSGRLGICWGQSLTLTKTTYVYTMQKWLLQGNKYWNAIINCLTHHCDILIQVSTNLGHRVCDWIPTVLGVGCDRQYNFLFQVSDANIHAHVSL